MHIIRAIVAAVTLLMGVPAAVPAQAAAGARPPKPAAFSVYPIGVVKKTQGRTLIALEKKYQPGLLGLDGFSHIYVFWWFDRNDSPDARATLQLHPRGNAANPLTGVFATHSPRRPNLIGLTVCKILSVEGNVVQIDSIDAFSGTPVLDVKPFIPGNALPADARSPEWTRR